MSPGETTLKLPVVKSGSKVYQVANVSRCMTADGQQVIIVVQRPSDDRAPAAPSVTATPAPIPTLRKPAPAVKLLPKQPQAYSSGDEGDDPSWTPSPVSTQVPLTILFPIRARAQDSGCFSSPFKLYIILGSRQVI